MIFTYNYILLNFYLSFESHNYFHLFPLHTVNLCLSHICVNFCGLLIITLQWGIYYESMVHCTLSLYYFTFLWPKGQGGAHMPPTLISFCVFYALFLIISLLEKYKDVLSQLDHFGLSHFYRDFAYDICYEIMGPKSLKFRL